MRIRHRFTAAGAVRLLAVMLAGLVVPSTWGQTTVVARPLEEVIAEARARYAERSLALALPLFAEWQERAPAGSIAALEAGAFQVACLRLVRMQNRTWDETERDFFASTAVDLRQRAQLLEGFGVAGREAWRRVLEVAALDLAMEGPEWDPLGQLLQSWARSTELERARGEYLRILWTASRQGRELVRFTGPERQAQVRNAARIALEPEDVARFNLLLAKVLVQDGDPDAVVRRGEALERAVAAGAGTEAYAESLWRLGQWAARFGTVGYDTNGERVFYPDFARAKEAYTRLLETSREEQQGWRMRAQQAREQLQRADLQVLVSHSFRPETEVQFALRWRNLEAPLVEVYRFDPTRRGYLEMIDAEQPPEAPAEAEFAYRGRLEKQPSSLHYPVLDTVRLERALPPGAYVIVARSGERVAWAPLFVTNLVLVAHRVGDEVVAFVADASNGKPRRDVTLRAELVVTPAGREREPERFQREGRSNEDGVWHFTWPAHQEGRLEWSIVARAPEEHGATVLSGRGWDRRETIERREAYLLTDRSLYRPGDTVRLIGWLRQRGEGPWSPPGEEERFTFALRSWSRGEIATGPLVVNAQGAFTLDFPLELNAGLGPYRLDIASSRAGVHWQSAEHLFSVEAYRPPEIEASVQLSSKVPHFPGDALEGTVQVDYYAGGAVEDAAVELVVTRTPFRPALARSWGEPFSVSALPSVFAPATPQEVARLQLETDARGTAAFTVPTERDAGDDWTYRLEARVRDPSRRETVAERSARVTRQAYFARLELPHRLVAPRDRVRLEVRLEDADARPVVDGGIVRVSRERWREVYVHRRRGTEISGEEYRSLPDRSMLSAAQSDYRLRDAGFVTEEISRHELVTGSDGRASLAYEPEAEGYYTFEWISVGERGRPIRAEVPLWVSDTATQEIGYRPGGVQLIADPGPFTLGEPIPVLVTAPVRNRWVLLSVSSRGLVTHRVVRLEGTSRLIQFEPTTAFQPNVFLDASLVSDETHFFSTLELAVPHREQVLEVAIEPDSDGYEPRDEARVTLRVRDHEGRPVRTRVAFSASDAALDAILPARRAPVVDAFFGEKIRHRLEASSSLERAPFFQPLELDETGEPDRAAGLVEARPGDDLEGLGASLAGLTTAPGPDAVLPGSGLERSTEAARAGAVEGIGTPLEAGPARPLSPVMRSLFRSTLHWAPEVETDAEGVAEVRFSFPDNLTAWRLQAVVVSAETQVGEASVRTATRLPLITRLQLPRFLTERDRAVLSGLVQNNTRMPVSVAAVLEAEGPVALRADAPASLQIAPAASARHDWTVEATAPGRASFRFRASTEEAGDAVARSFDIVPHGTEKKIGLIGQTGDGAVRLRIEDASEDARAAVVTLRLSTSLAPQLFGALPYLIDYPYGGTEQTLSRFLPALAVRRSARNLGLPLEALDATVFARLDPAAWGDRQDLRTVLDEVLAASLERLRSMQMVDGSWPWMPGGPGDPLMTTYAVWALTLAGELEVDLSALRLGEARGWLERALIERELPPAERAWALLALSSRYRATVFGRPSRSEARAFLDLMSQRETLAPMSLAMLALSARHYGFEEDTRLLLDNLANSVRAGEGVLPGAEDGSGRALTVPVVSWGSGEGYLSWSEGDVESTAWVLSALMAIHPTHPWVVPAVNWLSRNRVAEHWGNTRATALAILALDQYLASHAEVLAAARYSVSVDGEVLSGPDEGLWSSRDWAPVEIPLPAPSGEAPGTVYEIRRRDRAEPFHFELVAAFHDRTEGILAAASEVAIQREYWHLKPVETLLTGVREVMTPLPSGGVVASGDRVEAVLRLEVPRDLRYVLIEDFKPAGFEAVQLLSGPGAVARELAALPAASADGRPSYGQRSVNGFQELGDRKVAFLFDRLPAGTWEVRYRLRAESPGVFHALPATVAPLYLRPVHANSAESILEVRDER
jgi:alpha-2-macroglobulin